MYSLGGHRLFWNKLQMQGFKESGYARAHDWGEHSWRGHQTIWTLHVDMRK